MTTLKPVKVFSHTDLDGVGSGLIFQSLFGRGNVNVVYCDYNNVNERISEFLSSDEVSSYCDIFITDISVNEDVAKSLDAVNSDVSAPRIHLIDHHGTAEWLNKYDWALVKVVQEDGHKTSGTSLVLEYFDNEGGYIISDRLREFAEEVRRYDTWEWSTIYNTITPVDLNDYLYMIGRDKFVSAMLPRIQDEHASDNWFEEKGRALLDQRKKEIKAYINKKEQQLIIVEDKVGVIFAENHISELGNEICNRHEEIDYVAIFDVGAMKVSFRTVKDVDVSAIAKALGGGGHPKAAGASIQPESIQQFLKSI